MKHVFLLTAALVLGLPAWGDDVDASLPPTPDASVGSGGADMTSEENDPSRPCLDSSQCDLRTVCESGRCVPTKTRNAAGCGGGAQAAFSVVGVGLGLMVMRRKRSEHR